MHFGGKSSWSGVEEETATKEREEVFKTHFRGKWGEDAFTLIMKDGEGAAQTAKVSPFVERGDYRGAILALLPGKPPTLKEGIAL